VHRAFTSWHPNSEARRCPDVRITRSDHLDRNTPQSAGILRLAAINSDLSSSSISVAA